MPAPPVSVRHLIFCPARHPAPGYGKQSRCPMRRPPYEPRHGEPRQAGTSFATQTGNVGHPVREQAPDPPEVTANWSNTRRIHNQHRTSNSVPLAYVNPPMPGGSASAICIELNALTKTVGLAARS